jgi:8-oxo-dGTP diphosphatase
MPPLFCYDHPRPAVTVDVAAFTLLDGGLRVLLVKRKAPPFEGRWALPGGFLDIEEPIEHAARRELREETGLDAPGPVEFIGVFGDPGRDPRGRTLTLAHATVVRDPGPIAGGDDAAEAAWLDPYAKLGLAFDHDVILDEALAWFRPGPCLRLLPEEFSRGELSAIWGSPHPDIMWWSQKILLDSGQIDRVPGTSDRYRTVADRGPKEPGHIEGQE